MGKESNWRAAGQNGVKRLSRCWFTGLAGRRTVTGCELPPRPLGEEIEWH